MSNAEINQSVEHESNVLKRSLPTSAANHASLLQLAVAFLAGVCVLQLQTDIEVFRWSTYLSLFLLLLCATVFLVAPRWRNVAVFMAGFLWALFFAQSYLDKQLPEAFIGQDILIEGVIKDLPDYGARSVRFNFEVSRYIALNDQPINESMASLPTRLRLSWYYNKGRLHSGEHWRIKVRLKPPHGMMNPGGFDYEKWLYQQSIHATGYIRKGSSNQRIERAGLSIASIRESLLQQLSSLPDVRFQGLLKALTIGDKSTISAAQWQILQRTGTSHLMAISGLHIGLVATMVFFMMRWLVPGAICRYVSAPQVAAIVSIIAAGFYALLAGFSVPTQRAFIMLLVFMFAIIVKRPAFSLQTLAWALIGVLLVNPISVLSVGFWLSFTAVLIIIIVSSNRLKPPAGKFTGWLLGLRIQWLIALGMLPLSVVLFQQGSLVSPLANMLAIPLVGMIIVPLALLASLLNVVSAEASLWLFSQTSTILSLVWALLLWLADSPFASWQRSSVPLVISILAIMGALLLLLPKGIVIGYSGFILLLPIMLYQPPKPGLGEFWVDVLDVGQGLSVLVQTHNKTLLYDTGAKFSPRFDIGQRVIVPYLNYIGVSHLNYLLISHGDNDHAGGADAVMQMLDVEVLIAESEVFKQKSRLASRDKICEAGRRWEWDGVNFEILHPAGIYQKSNNRSCVLKISNANSGFLMAGDIERKAETQMLKLASTKIAADILLVPHHGSNTSSSPAWLEMINPQVAIVSAGYKNRFSHPTQKILQRYQQRGIEVINTAQAGMIQLKFGAVNEKPAIQVKQQRKVSTHYWNHRVR